MFILEKPYVSDLLVESLCENFFPVLENDISLSFKGRGLNLISESEFISAYKNNPGQPLYSNSENAIGWMDKNLGFSDLPAGIRLFKDKAAFRKMMVPENPDFFFKEVKFDDLDKIDPAQIPIPSVLKPAVGFFSLGVHMIESTEDWYEAVKAIKKDVNKIQAMYPVKVLEIDRFIIEQSLEGEEFAVDAYYDSEGNPVILNIFGHIFASSCDVSDRVYYTSTEIIVKHHDAFKNALSKANAGKKLKNFPLHAEIRITEDGSLGFIEINPMRFAGWCVTDLSYYAYGIKTYEYFMAGKRPDWNALAEAHKDKIYSMVIGEIDGNVDLKQIRSVDYDGFKTLFKKPLALRRIDFNKHPVFAFMFAEFDKSEMASLKALTTADFNKYIII